MSKEEKAGQLVDLLNISDILEQETFNELSNLDHLNKRNVDISELTPRVVAKFNIDGLRQRLVAIFLSQGFSEEELDLMFRAYSSPKIRNELVDSDLPFESEVYRAIEQLFAEELKPVLESLNFSGLIVERKF